MSGDNNQDPFFDEDETPVKDRRFGVCRECEQSFPLSGFDLIETSKIDFRTSKIVAVSYICLLCDKELREKRKAENGRR